MLCRFSKIFRLVSTLYLKWFYTWVSGNQDDSIFGCMQNGQVMVSGCLQRNLGKTLFNLSLNVSMFFNNYISVKYFIKTIFHCVGTALYVKITKAMFTPESVDLSFDVYRDNYIHLNS